MKKIIGLLILCLLLVAGFSPVVQKDDIIGEKYPDITAP